MTGAQVAGTPGREADGVAASAVKAMQAEGGLAEARERYAELVARHQRRATRIAYHYVRDSAEADEAVQDAFVKAYSHLSTFRAESGISRSGRPGIRRRPKRSCCRVSGAGKSPRRSPSCRTGSDRCSC